MRLQICTALCALIVVAHGVHYATYEGVPARAKPVVASQGTLRVEAPEPDPAFDSEEVDEPEECLPEMPASQRPGVRVYPQAAKVAAAAYDATVVTVG